MFVWNNLVKKRAIISLVLLAGIVCGWRIPLVMRSRVTTTVEQKRPGEHGRHVQRPRRWSICPLLVKNYR